jgi:hypothetical protein
MAKKLKLTEGDVFTIPLGNGEVGFGQIIAFPHSKNAFMMVVFDYKIKESDSYDIKSICQSPILLLGNSLDAKLYHEDWKIIGNNKENISRIVFPYYRLGTPPKDIYIVNYRGERLKEITEKVFNQLQYELNVSPIRYENALKAHFKLQEWKSEDYDRILYTNALKSKEVFEKL